jgi:hypothetical protein
MMFIWLGSFNSVSASGNASASDSRLATSFLEARRRLLDLAELFSIFETKLECLIKRLSFFVVRKSSSNSEDLVESETPLPEAGLARFACFLIDRVGACVRN